MMTNTLNSCLHGIKRGCYKLIQLKMLLIALLITVLLLPVAAQAAEEDPLSPIGAAANPYGLAALWAQGDLVAKGTLVLLVLMSLASWYVMFSKLLEQWRVSMQAKALRQQLTQTSSLVQAINGLKPVSIYYQIAHQGLLSEQQYTDELAQRIDLNTWLGQSIHSAVDDARSQLSGGLSLLATVGSTAPFVGLFGTVWGIYHALTAIGISGQASIDKVAGPVGEALIMTAIGLAVAVPAVLGYNALVRCNKISLDYIHRFADELHARLLKGDVMPKSQAKLQE
jgi:biopolymer transport protein ExbB